MNEQQCLERMVAPGTRRPGKYREGVVQIHVTRACDKACNNCTQGSELAGPTPHMTVEQFRQAVESLRGYFGVVGVFGGNPAMHPNFVELCRILRDSWVPKEQRGIWCNHPLSLAAAQEMACTFDPAVSNLNVHLDAKAYAMFRMGWPECSPVGLMQDSRHAPVHVSMRDLGVPESDRWDLISGCDVNQHWSAMVGVFRGQLRAWFCEVAGAQAMLHQDEPDYPDTGLPMPPAGSNERWWQLPMHAFADQVHQHCHNCGIPLKGLGALAIAEGGATQLSATHPFQVKRKNRRIETVTKLQQLNLTRLHNVTRYLQNARV